MNIDLSIGHEKGPTGTATFVFVVDAKPYVVSCAHVIAPSGCSIGDAVIAPGLRDRLEPRKIGLLEFFIKLDSGANFPNKFDFAIAQLIVDPLSLKYPKIDLTDSALPFRDDSVTFKGRSSSSQGQIIDPNDRWHMRLNSRYFGFSGQMKTSCPSTDGDSGALLFSDNDRPVGILLGQGLLGAVATPLWKISHVIMDEISKRRRA